MHEVDNPFDFFAIKTVNSDKVITGPLPREISRVTKILLDRGAIAYAELKSTHYRRSPRMKGALEIPCKITVKLHGTVKNHMLLDRYMQLVNSIYCDPKKEDIMGSFLTKMQLSALRIAASSVKKTVKKKAREDGSNGVDICKFFAAKERIMLNKATHSKRNNDPTEISDSDS